MKVFQTGLDQFLRWPRQKTFIWNAKFASFMLDRESNIECELHKIKTVFDIMLTSVLVLR